MLVALYAKDRPGSAAIRAANRPAHLDYLKSADVVAQAGPLLTATGEMAGSLIILDVADMDAARAWAEGDPYAAAGLFETVELIEWKRVIG